MSNDEKKITSIIKTGLRSIGASIPGAASIANAWNEWDSKKRWDYAIKFFDEVQIKVSENEEKILAQKEYLGFCSRFGW